MDRKYRLGSSDCIVISDIGIKSKIIDFLFNSIDLSKFRYNMLMNLQKLNFLKEQEHYVTPNFHGYNYLLIFLTIDDVKYSVAIEKKKLSYHKNQIDVKNINMFKVLVSANQAIFRGTIFDCKLINVPDKKRNTNDNQHNRYNYYMLIKDCYFLMGNQLLDVEMSNKIVHIDNILKNNFSKSCKNFTFKVNKLWKYEELKNLIEKIIPTCGIKCQGLIFYPKYSGVNVVYLDKQQEKIDISSNNNEKVEYKSYNMITNLEDFLKSRTYSYETNGKTKKLWLKNTEIPDVFNIFEKLNDDKLGIAHIPNLKISHMCKNEMSSLQSNDAKEFNCTYDKNFKKWIPISSI